MPRFAANLSMLFTELPFRERFAAAAAAGFQGVEVLFPYAEAAGSIRERLRENGLEQVLFNLPPGDWDAGERGLAALPGREADFRDSVALALDYARALGCRRLHAMAGVIPEGVEHRQCEAVYLRNLRYAAGEAARLDCTIVIEPINRVDMPGYFLSRQADARRHLEAVGADNLRLQFDVYHCQMTEGRISHWLEHHLPVLEHVQVAGVPGRHEPQACEIDYVWLFRLLDRIGYRGWVGCEYRPANTTTAGLQWGRPWGIGD